MGLVGGKSSEAGIERCVHTLGCPIFDLVAQYCPDGLVPNTQTCNEALKKALEEQARLKVLNRNILIRNA